VTMSGVVSIARQISDLMDLVQAFRRGFLAFIPHPIEPDCFLALVRFVHGSFPGTRVESGETTIMACAAID
jgi:hypothetical protein